MKARITLFIVIILLLLTACHINGINDTPLEKKIKENADNITVAIWGDYDFTKQYKTKTLKDTVIPAITIDDDMLKALPENNDNNDYKILIVSTKKIDDFMDSDEWLQHFFVLLDDGYDIFFILDDLDYAQAEALSNELCEYMIGQDIDHSDDPENSKNILFTMHINKDSEHQYIPGTIEFMGRGYSKQFKDFMILRSVLRQDN